MSEFESTPIELPAAPSAETASAPPAASAHKATGHPILISTLALLVVLVSGLIGGIIGHQISGNQVPSQASPVPQWFHITLPQSPQIKSTKLSSDQKKFVKTIDKAVVDISATSDYTSNTERATGMVLTPSGLVLTNNHAIAGATSISVREVTTGTTYQASVVGYDTKLDVAVLQLTGAHGLATVPLATHSKVSVGESVVALGNAEGTNAAPVVVTGKVVAKHKSITASGGPTGSENLSGLIFDNAPIVPGDSGGPLVSPKGRVIAMDTAASASTITISPTPQTAPTTQSYAIPIATAEKVVTALSDHTSLPGLHAGPSAFLGVEIGDTATSSGAVVLGLTPNSPASALAPGDVITALGTTTVTTPTSLLDALLAYTPGESVSITYVNTAGVTQSTQVTLSMGPAQ